MRHALEKSCNVYFYTLGNMLGVDRIHKWAENLGLAGLTGIDLPNEQESIVPSTQWKLAHTGERWYPGETISVSIGQGQVTVTPASLAVMISTVATAGGVTPHIIRAVETGGWKCPPPASPNASHSTDDVAPLPTGLARGGERRRSLSGVAAASSRDVAARRVVAVISNQGRLAARGSGRDLRDMAFSFSRRRTPRGRRGIFASTRHGYLGAPLPSTLSIRNFAKGVRPLPDSDAGAGAEASRYDPVHTVVRCRLRGDPTPPGRYH